MNNKTSRKIDRNTLQFKSMVAELKDIREQIAKLTPKVEKAIAKQEKAGIAWRQNRNDEEAGYGYIMSHDHNHNYEEYMFEYNRYKNAQNNSREVEDKFKEAQSDAEEVKRELRGLESKEHHLSSVVECEDKFNEAQQRLTMLQKDYRKREARIKTEHEQFTRVSETIQAEITRDREKAEAIYSDPQKLSDLKIRQQLESLESMLAAKEKQLAAINDKLASIENDTEMLSEIQKEIRSAKDIAQGLYRQVLKVIATQIIERDPVVFYGLRGNFDDQITHNLPKTTRQAFYDEFNLAIEGA